MIRSCRHTGISIVLLALLSAFSSAQALSTFGGLPGAPFRLGSGARGAAMGNAMVAITDGPLAGTDNPALAPFQQGIRVSAAYSALSLDRRLNFLTFGQPLKPNAGVSFQIVNAGVSAIDIRDRDGVKSGDASTSENAFVLSFGLRPDERLAIGVSTKIFYYSLYEDVKSTTVGFNVGAVYRISDEITAGAALLDLGSRYKWDTRKLYGRSGNTDIERFPLRKELGIAASLRGWRLLGAVQIEWLGSTPLWKSGIEWQVHDLVALRAGIDQVSFSGAITARPSIGFCIHQSQGNWTPNFEYTYVAEPYSPHGMHLLGLAVSFP